ncbi:MAG: hypothetical protein ABIU76_04375, partial [Gemmatimonadaceae bacterium]
MRWLLLVPLLVACDRIRPPATAERPVDTVGTVVAVVPDTATPIVAAPPVAPDSTAVAAPDSTVAAVPDNAPAPTPDSTAVSRAPFVIPASLSKLSPAPDGEAMEFDDEDFPVLPHVNYGDCEGENCSASLVAYSCRPAALRATASGEAPIVARVPQGELLRVRRDLHLQSAGIVVVKQDFVLDWDEVRNQVVPRADTVHLAEGDTVFVLRYLDQGRWTWAYQRRLHDSGEFWTTITRSGAKLGESEYAVRRSHPM